MAGMGDREISWGYRNSPVLIAWLNLKENMRFPSCSNVLAVFGSRREFRQPLGC